MAAQVHHRHLDAAAAVLVVTSLEDMTAGLVIAAMDEGGVPVVRVDPAGIDPPPAAADARRAAGLAIK